MSTLAKTLDKVVTGEMIHATRSAVSSDALLQSIKACRIGFIATLPIMPTNESAIASPKEKIAFAKV